MARSNAVTASLPQELIDRNHLYLKLDSTSYAKIVEHLRDISVAVRGGKRLL
jgi:hypothetical protein